MTKTYTYTPRRRVAMQAVMFGILLAVIGLAALYDHALTTRGAVQLTPEQNFGVLHLRLPADWTRPPRNRRAPGAVVVLREPADSGDSDSQRTLVIYRQHVPPGMSPEQYLEAMDMISDIFGGVDPQQLPAKMGSIPAVRLSGVGAIPTSEGMLIKGDMVLCAVFPGGQAVTLWLERQGGELARGDRALLDQIAATVRIDAPAATRP